MTRGTIKFPTKAEQCQIMPPCSSYRLVFKPLDQYGGAWLLASGFTTKSDSQDDIRGGGGHPNEDPPEEV